MLRRAKITNTNFFQVMTHLLPACLMHLLPTYQNCFQAHCISAFQQCIQGFFSLDPCVSALYVTWNPGTYVWSPKVSTCCLRSPHGAAPNPKSPALSYFLFSSLSLGNPLLLTFWKIFPAASVPFHNCSVPPVPWLMNSPIRQESSIQSPQDLLLHQALEAFYFVFIA